MARRVILCIISILIIIMASLRRFGIGLVGLIRCRMGGDLRFMMVMGMCLRRLSDTCRYLPEVKILKVDVDGAV